MFTVNTGDMCMPCHFNGRQELNAIPFPAIKAIRNGCVLRRSATKINTTTVQTSKKPVSLSAA